MLVVEAMGGLQHVICINQFCKWEGSELDVLTKTFVLCIFTCFLEVFL